MKQFTVSEQKIRLALHAYPDNYAKTVIKSLVPEAFQDNRSFCRIGQLFMRKSYPNSVYALVKIEGKVKFLNITHNTFWAEERQLNVRDLRHPDGDWLTVSEFKKLTLEGNFHDFRLIELRLANSTPFSKADRLVALQAVWVDDRNANVVFSNL